MMRRWLNMSSCTVYLTVSLQHCVERYLERWERYNSEDNYRRGDDGYVVTDGHQHTTYGSHEVGGGLDHVPDFLFCHNSLILSLYFGVVLRCIRPPMVRISR